MPINARKVFVYLHLRVFTLDAFRENRILCVWDPIRNFKRG